MYNEVIKRLREEAKFPFNDNRDLFTKAADAIEELQKDLERSKDFEAFWQHEAEEALKKFQVAISNKPRWIPVTERLPKNHQHCLVFTDTHRMGYFAKNLEKVDEYDFQGEKHHGWYYLDSEWGYCEIRNVSYWMPLPQPPEDCET